MLSEQPRLYAPFQKLIETIKYKPETPEQAANAPKRRQNAPGKCGRLAGFCGARFLKRYGNEAQMETYAVLREAFLSGEAGSVEQISAFKKSVTGRVIPKSERNGWNYSSTCCPGCPAQEAPQIDGWRPILPELPCAWVRNERTAAIGTATRK